MIYLVAAILILAVLYFVGGEIYAERPSIQGNSTTPPEDDTIREGV